MGCASSSEIDRSLERSARYLLAKQGDDGGWHSEAYSALRDGHALTPIVLSALLFAAQVDGLPEAYRRGSDFVASLPEDVDYPVYSMSGALLVLSVPLNQRHVAAKDAIADRLFARQLAEPLGWSPADPAYGGWGYHRGLPQKRETPDQLLTSNIASTLFAVGALALAGAPLDDERFAKALAFTQRCQNQDGGFFFTPTDEAANKAGGFRSYGTATADGLRTLMRLGVSRSDPRVRAAASWMGSHFDPERVPGEYASDREVQRDSAYYYWTWTAAHALMLLGPEADRMRTNGWPSALAAALMKRQLPDGSWRNPAVDLREDDPLVATSLAAGALAICRAMQRESFDTAIDM